MDQKVLFTTVFRKKKLYDYYETNSRWKFFRFSWPRTCSFGLRFIKQNIPTIEILEYPTWKEYTRKLKEGNYDVVGFSFYINEIPEIIEMIEYARKNGVKEIWGGNYGILTPNIKKYFDKIITGYAEHQIAEELDIEIDRIKHPPLVNYTGTSFSLKICTQGILFPTRGCNLSCKMCQTPSFCPESSKVPIESIEETLKYYKKLGIRIIGAEDENFGLSHSHANQVVDLLKKYDFLWTGLTRADIVQKNLDSWIKKNMTGVYTSVENFNQVTLDAIDKKEKIEQIIELIKELKRRKIFVGIFYMIGFQDETKDSIKKDMKLIKNLGVDITQICVLTPLPKTPMWDYLDKNFGIFDYNWHHYDTKHLVWNHPNIKPEEMKKLLDDCFKIAYPRSRVFSTTLTWSRILYKGKNPLTYIPSITSMILKANLVDYKKIRVC